MFVCMVSRYVELWHGGLVPQGEARIRFIARVLDEYLPDSSRTLASFTEAEWAAHRAECAGHLVTACDCLARQQGARWQN
jgi:hypothetical protein